MDAFFAAIEQLDHPKLRGKPLLVGHDGPRGVVTTASYEARPFGCHSAQPMSVAKRRCPRAIVVPVRGERYREVSRRLFEILDEFTPLVEPLSVDEAFLDVTGMERLMGTAVEIAAKLKQRVREELRLNASVGVAANKFLAKLASDMDKPDGLTVVTPEMTGDWLGDLPISKMWGVGPATVKKFQAIGVRRFADLRALTPAQLNAAFGRDGDRFGRLARGLDDRPVTPDHEAKSIGQEHTFGLDVRDIDMLRQVLLGQVEQVGRRLRKHGRRARGVTLKLRHGDFTTLTRSATLPEPTDTTDGLWRAGRDLFERWASSAFRPLRLIGFTAGPLAGADDDQLGLFPDPATGRQRRLDAATDRIAARYGKRAIHRGGG